MMRTMIKISEIPFDPNAEQAAFENVSSVAGAIVSFLGKVRGEGGRDPVLALELEHYPGVTERSISEIAARARERWRLDAMLIIHRVGRLEPGEPIVLVCTSAQHRRDAFQAADFLMDYLKTDALFWKKEVRHSGALWVEPRPADYQDRERWSGKEGVR